MLQASASNGSYPHANSSLQKIWGSACILVYGDHIKLYLIVWSSESYINHLTTRTYVHIIEVSYSHLWISVKLFRIKSNIMLLIRFVLSFFIVNSKCTWHERWQYTSDTIDCHDGTRIVGIEQSMSIVAICVESCNWETDISLCRFLFGCRESWQVLKTKHRNRLV